MVSCHRIGGWKSVAQLCPLPLPGAALCLLDPPQLLVAAPGAQLQSQPSLAALDESGGHPWLPVQHHTLKLLTWSRVRTCIVRQAMGNMSGV